MASPRPSTSGGTSAKASSRVNFDKRMSKDDLSLFSKPRQNQNFDKTRPRDDMYIRNQMAAMSRYHVPVRASTLTPEQSPDSDFPITHEVSIPVRMQTPESIKSGEIPIGMALGSPSRLAPTDSSRWQAQFPTASPAVNSSEPSPATAGPTGPLQRKKTGRRKLFGLFGGGKKNVEQKALAQGEAAKSTTTLAKQMAASTSTLSITANRPAPSRSNTQSERKAPKHKPIMIRSSTMPYDANDGVAPAPKSAGLPALRSKASEPRMRQGNPYQQPRPAVPLIPTFLDVHIPETKLERYSVMFSDVLNQGPKHELAGSLLARRQATLERLKTVNDGIEADQAEKQQRGRMRRATSPQPTPSPQLKLFPMPPQGRVTPDKFTRRSPTPTTSSRLARSNTSPGRLPSPTQTIFSPTQPPKPAKGAATLTVPKPFEVHPPQRSTSREARPAANQEPIYPTDTSFNFGPEEPAIVLDSPKAMEETEEIIISQPFKPTLHEPQWQMISPNLMSPKTISPPSASSSVLISISSSGRRRSPSADSSVHTPVTKSSSEIEGADPAFQSAVEVSIARQISISRQQRHMLRPLQTKRTDGKVVGGTSPLGLKVVKATSPSNKIGGKDEPIKEIQTSTPTLIHPRENPVNPRELAQNRKSSWVVLEG